MICEPGCALHGIEVIQQPLVAAAAGVGMYAEVASQPFDARFDLPADIVILCLTAEDFVAFYLGVASAKPAAGNDQRSNSRAGHTPGTGCESRPRVIVPRAVDVLLGRPVP